MNIGTYEEEKMESFSKNLAWFVSIQLQWNWILVTVGDSDNICICCCCCCCLFPFTSRITTCDVLTFEQRMKRGSKDYDFRLRKWFLFKQNSQIHIVFDVQFAIRNLQFAGSQYVWSFVSSLCIKTKAFPIPY